MPVAPEQEFVVITNNYRADSGHIVRSPDDIVVRAPNQTRDIISRYIITETINVETPPCLVLRAHRPTRHCYV